MEATHPYPAQWEADVVLRDGATMHIRPVRPEDDAAFRALHAGQSESSIYYRFFAPRSHLSDKDVRDFLNVDQHRDVSLALFEGSGKDAVMTGIGGFNTTRDGVAEVAFYVADSQHGRGLGSVLFDHLAAAARELGIHEFEAFVMPQNRKMINVFKDAGYRLHTSLDDGVIEIRIDLRSTTEAWRVMMQREQHSEALAMQALMAPGAYVLLDDERAVLAPLAARLLESGADLVRASEADLAGRLALISTPTPQLADVLDDLGERGVRAAIVYSGHHTVDAETSLRILRAARGAGMRLLGPASHGIVTIDGTDLTIEAGVPTGGNVDLFVQSAEAAVQLLTGIRTSGLALRTMVAAGHRLDISGNDTMQYWAANPSEGPALICLDTVGNARKFARIARHLATGRPVFALITAGVGSDTLPGHLVSTSSEGPRVLHHILWQSGVVASRSPREILDLTRVAAQQGVPAGTRLGIITSSEALATALTAAARRHELQVAARLDIDLEGLEPFAAQAEALQRECDAVIVALTAVNETQTRALADARDELLGIERLVPWVAVVGGTREDRIPTPTGPLPHFGDTETALSVLARLSHAEQRRSELADAQLVAFDDLKLSEAHALVEAAAGEEDAALSEEQSADLLACYGIDLLPAIEASTEEESLAAAEKLGYPVVLKSGRSALRHRADLGGVALDLGDPEAVRAAARRFLARGEERWDVQSMAPAGAACVVSAWEDPLYGPVISFALAGDAEEILQDISYRIAPLTEADSHQIIEEVAAAVRLKGYRGLPPLDIDALAELIARLSLLKDDLADVARIRLHPVIVGENGVHVAGASVTVRDAHRSDDARRALRSPTA
ncbi:GNAT family N-acetyltransferase [Bowdeniella massiliensis]|uniref:GNAT family N-acetyltransferase n=1 Tax=Bowdeniella massiliensis TaxID=2932264 RepID=UPI002027D42B|nr:GNAT family N-acetyltransferase [Bowdeniella massiliensis]